MLGAIDGVPDEEDIVEIVATNDAFVALRADGSVVSWVTQPVEVTAALLTSTASPMTFRFFVSSATSILSQLFAAMVQ